MRRALVPLVLLLAACGGDPARRIEAGPAVPTAPEQALLERMTVDPFVRIARTDRDAEGRLWITTRQGDLTIRYIAVKPADGGDRLQAMLVADEPQLEVADDGTRGTGADRRGLGAR